MIPQEIITAIQRRPLNEQIDIMQAVANGAAFGELTNVYTDELDRILAALHRDAIDAAAAEQVQLHGVEVASLTSVYYRNGGVWA